VVVGEDTNHDVRGVPVVGVRTIAVPPTRRGSWHAPWFGTRHGPDFNKQYEEY